MAASAIKCRLNAKMRRYEKIGLIIIVMINFLQSERLLDYLTPKTKISVNCSERMSNYDLDYL